MKNMKVSMKLISSFLVVILLAAAIGVFGIFGLNSMSNEAEHMYTDMGVPLGELGLASEYFQRIRVQLRNTIIYTGDVAHLQTIETDLSDRMKNFEADMIRYEPTIVTDAGKQLFKETMAEYNGVMKSGVTTILEHAMSGMAQAQLLEEMNSLSIAADNIANNLRELTQMRLTVMSDANDTTTTMFNTLSLVIIGIIAVAVCLSLFLAFYISSLISKPLVPLAGFMTQAGATGNITLREDDVRVITTYAQRKDEIGLAISGAASFVTRMEEVSEAMDAIAGGDLTVELSTLSDNDVMGKSLNRVNDKFREMNSFIDPLSVLRNFMEKASVRGDLLLTPEDMSTIDQYAVLDDEYGIGKTILACAGFVQRITAVSEVLGTIASGDLSINVNALSDQDTMGLALENMSEKLNEIFQRINMASDQVSSGSKQVSDGSQAVSQGATEQAASIQELTATVSEIAEQVKQTSENVSAVNRDAIDMRKYALEGTDQMQQMQQSMDEINTSSASISKIIKVIDDIAFQTNILSLNAAVEAARAGVHGKGFAVVAEEVRNLAAKSATAAKETTELIEGSSNKVAVGTKIANETAESLAKIVEMIERSVEALGQVAVASNEQAMGISQVNIGIDQMSQVVQTNSATAEETAAATEELSSQAELLKQLISQFKLKDGGNAFGYGVPSQPAQRPATTPSTPRPSRSSIRLLDTGNGLSDSEFGKY